MTRPAFVPSASPRADRRTRIVEVAEALRTRLLRAGIALALLAAALFPLAESILGWFQRRTAAPLAAFGIADPFLALVTVALGSGAVVVLPHLAWACLAAAADGFPILTRRVRWLFWGTATLLFFAGMGFCLGITLPYGSRFLLGFGSESLQPVICVRQFVSFCLIFTLGFGILFELPLIMALLAWLQVVSAAWMAGYRRYAVVLIVLVAAVVTPTPDVVNLLLLAAPLYLLFELGILGMRFCERRQRASAPQAPRASAAH